MLKQYPEITLHKGASSIVKFDFSNIEMGDGFHVFTMKDKVNKTVLKSIRFDEAREYNIAFDDDFTKDLSTVGEYCYDIMYHLNENRFPRCAVSPIKVVETVGGRNNEQ